MKYPTEVEVKAKRHAAEFEEACVRGRQQIYYAFPVVSKSMANDAGLDEVCAHFLGVSVGTIAPDLSTFRSAVEEDPSLLKGGGRLIIEPVEQQRQRAIDEISELIVEWHPHNRRQELTKLRFKSLDEIQARKAQILEERRLRPMSVSAIKAELQAARPTPQVKVLPAEYTRQRIHSMPSSEIRKLIRDFSATAVNDRLFSRS